ncbi:MAG: tetratricopeptide repeat protein, partial [Planctomycetes bacterium]|nr:tetratricopeptide repeat protein [Planctomycetota bacterium]
MIDPETVAAYELHRGIGNRQFRSSCYAPFTSLYFNTNGDVIACCKNTTYVLGNVAQTRLHDIWHGKRVKAMRKALSTYNFKLGCEFCEWQIQGGGFDQVYTNTFDELPLRGEDPEWPSMLEFTLSNTCNLACIMCYGVLSSTIRAHRENLPPLPKVYDDQFFADLRDFLPHLKIAKFFGGEPFLAQESYRVWDMMIEDGITIPCHVTTNGTQWNAKVERILEHFPIGLSISVDGATKETAESIRVNMDFEKVTRNVERFVDYARDKGTYLSLTYCLMRQNWHEFGDYLAYGEELGVDVFVNTVIDPADCSLYTLPPDELATIVTRLEELEEKHRFSELARNGGRWASALDALRKNANERQKAGIESVKAANMNRSLIGRAWKHLLADEPNKALEVVRTIPDGDSRKYQARLAEARALCDLDRLDEADTTLGEAIASWRRSPSAFFVRAAMRLRKDRVAEANEDLEQAAEVARDASHEDWQMVLPHVWDLVDAGKFEHGLTLVDAFLRSPERRPAGLLARAAIRLRQERDEEAREDIEQAVADGRPIADADWRSLLPQIWRLTESGAAARALTLLDAMPAQVATASEPTLARARALRLQRRDDEAERILDELIEREPDVTAAYVERAWIRLERGDDADGHADAEAAQRTCAEGSRTRPAVLHLLAFAAKRAGRFDDALAHVEELMAAQPSAEFALLRGEILGDLHRFAEAEAALDDVVAAPHKHAVGLLVRSTMRMRQGRMADAHTDIRAAVSAEAAATDADWLVVIPHIWSLTESGNPDGALELLDAMSERVALTNDATLARARALRLLQRDDEAERVLDAALERDPELTEAWVERAWIRVERGDESGGEHDADAASRTAGDDVGTRAALLHLRAFAARRAGRLDQALAHIDELLATMPGADFALLRAEILGELGRVDEAADALEEVIRAPHKRAAGLLVRAAMRTRQGRPA